jgi:hypothetical protein
MVDGVAEVVGTGLEVVPVDASGVALGDAGVVEHGWGEATTVVSVGLGDGEASVQVGAGMGVTPEVSEGLGASESVGEGDAPPASPVSMS